MALRSDTYDFVFLGVGCAAQSLLVRLLDSSEFRNSRILLIDQEEKKHNDRTWCFWEKKTGYFDSVVCKRWNTLSFKHDSYRADFSVSPYQYKMIRSADFYSYTANKINQCTGVDVVYGAVKSFSRDGNSLWIFLENESIQIKANYVFNSIPALGVEQKGSVQLLQHFKGWFVETEVPFFDDSKATLMDFTISQEKGTAFMYVLPLSATRALIEYTFFTESILTDEEYETGLRSYLSKSLGLNSYTILEKEFGVIPMNDNHFSFESNGVYNIGMIGGQTKGSTGYTFQFIQKRMEALSKLIIAGKPLSQLKNEPARFLFYDRVLLRVLAYGYYPGAAVFAKLFSKNKPQQIFKFLDNETCLSEELSIISKLPWVPFLKALVKRPS
jgi:lycopene beta-cyclase